VKRLALFLTLVGMAACATKSPPALPGAPKYPDFLYPTVPRELQTVAEADAVRRGWHFLQADDLRNADREFSRAVRRLPGLYPAQTGVGYVALARHNYDKAVTDFELALKQQPKYIPALVGKGDALFGLKRDEAALASFESALAIDESLGDIRRRVDVLRFRNVEAQLERARSAAKAGRLDDARGAYRRAIDASPESAVLYRELGTLERRRGDIDTAITQLRRAVELEPGDTATEIQLGELLEQRMEFAEAEAVYRKAAESEPSDELSRRIADVAAKAREAKLPPQFRTIPESPEITRGDLAALIGIRFDALLATALPRQVVMTDVRSHWAAPWIDEVARAGILDPFANHTFQPHTPIRRVDFATAVSRLLTLAAPNQPELRARLAAAKPRIADVGPGHLDYPAVATAVASGAMPLLEGDRFGIAQPVSGAEALEVLDRVQALSRPGQ
jgi:tetratricopeptide (TPR) repeat protein